MRSGRQRISLGLMGFLWLSCTVASQAQFETPATANAVSSPSLQSRLARSAGRPLVSTFGLPVPPNRELLDRYNLQRHWTAQIPILVGRETVTSLKLHDDRLYVTTSHGMIHCLGAESGVRLWSAEVVASQTRVFDPAISNRGVFAVAGRTVTALHPENGRVLWIRDLPNAASTAPAVSDRFLFVAGTDHRVYVVALEEDPNRKFTRRPIVWDYYTGAKMVNPPFAAGNMVLFLPENGILYAFEEAQKSSVYRYYANAATTAPAAIYGGTLFMPTDNAYLFSIDVLTGGTRWHLPTSRPVIEAPAAFQGVVYLIVEELGLVAVDDRLGKILWSNPEIRRFVSAGETYLFALDRNDSLVVISRDTGVTKTRLPLVNFTRSVANTATDRLFLASDSGMVINLHDKAYAEPYVHPQPKLETETDVLRPAAPSTSPGSTPAAPATDFFGTGAPSGSTPPAGGSTAPAGGGFFDNPAPPAGGGAMNPATPNDANKPAGGGFFDN